MSERSNGMQRREKRALVRMVEATTTRLYSGGGRRIKGVSAAAALGALQARGLVEKADGWHRATDAGKAMARSLRSAGDGVRGLR